MCSCATLQFEQQIAQQVSYNATLHRHRRRFHARAGEVLTRKLDAKKQVLANGQIAELSDLHESIAGHFWEAIKGRLTETGEGGVTEAELMGFCTSAIWSTQFNWSFTGYGWQVYCSYQSEAISELRDVDPPYILQHCCVSLITAPCLTSLAPICTQAQLQECIQSGTYRPDELGWIKLQLKIAQECSHWEMFDSLLVKENGEHRSSTE